MSTDRTKPVLVGTTRPVESRSAERQSALDGRHVHDHTRAALDHGGEEPPIEPDGGVQVLVDGLLPELIRGGLETPTRRGRAPTLWTMTSTPLKRSSVSPSSHLSGPRARRDATTRPSRTLRRRRRS
jgi:hypothetical protein